MITQPLSTAPATRRQHQLLTDSTSYSQTAPATHRHSHSNYTTCTDEKYKNKENILPLEVKDKHNDMNSEKQCHQNYTTDIKARCSKMAQILKVQYQFL